MARRKKADPKMDDPRNDTPTTTPPPIPPELDAKAEEPAEVDPTVALFADEDKIVAGMALGEPDATRLKHYVRVRPGFQYRHVAPHRVDKLKQMGYRVVPACDIDRSQLPGDNNSLAGPDMTLMFTTDRIARARRVQKDARTDARSRSVSKSAADLFGDHAFEPNQTGLGQRSNDGGRSSGPDAQHQGIHSG